MLQATVFLVPLLVSAAPLRVSLDRNYPPFAFRNADGKLEGYSVDLWRLWEQKTGRKVELHPVEWPSVQPMLLSGQVDMADTIFRTQSRTGHLDFSTSYAVVATSIYADTSIAGIHDSASLRGFEVAMQAGDACVERLQRIGGIGVRVFATYQGLREALAERRVKLLCRDDYAANYDLYRLGVHERYVKAFELGRSELRRAVRKGDTATLALVERGMAQITPAELD